MLKVSEQWLQGLDRETREETKKLLLGNTILLDLLTKILYNMKKGREGTVLGDYDSPSWSHKQAHLNGMHEAFDQVIRLLSITERADQPNI